MEKALVALGLFVVLAGCIEQEKPVSLLENAFVERVIDGDTFVLNNGEKVRLVGINAPEKNDYCWEESKERLEELVLGKKVVLERDFSDRDKYGRLVRLVYSQGELVNLLLVEEGLALSFEFEPDTRLLPLFLEAEDLASRTGGCLWKK